MFYPQVTRHFQNNTQYSYAYLHKKKPYVTRKTLDQFRTVRLTIIYIKIQYNPTKHILFLATYFLGFRIKMINNIGALMFSSICKSTSLDYFTNHKITRV